MCVGVAILIRFHFHDRILAGIVNDELNAIEALAGVSVNLNWAPLSHKAPQRGAFRGFETAV